MSFISKSVNFSQPDYFKKELLMKALELYNVEYSKMHTSEQLSVPREDFIVPNNNNKFYLFVISKSKIDSSRAYSFSTLYFFNDNDDFFIETECKFPQADSGLLLEGYLYKESNEKQHYLMTDFLVRGETVVDLDYPLRYQLIIELLRNIPRGVLLNNHTRIGVHPVVSSENDQLVKIMKCNFRFSGQLTSTEVIYSRFRKRMHIETTLNETETNQVIVKERYPDTYSVLDKYGLKSGILFVKGLRESRYMRCITQGSPKVTLTCTFNNTFRKWQPVIPDTYTLH